MTSLSPYTQTKLCMATVIICLFLFSQVLALPPPVPLPLGPGPGPGLGPGPGPLPLVPGLIPPIKPLSFSAAPQTQFITMNADAFTNFHLNAVNNNNNQLTSPTSVTTLMHPQQHPHHINTMQFFGGPLGGPIGGPIGGGCITGCQQVATGGVVAGGSPYAGMFDTLGGAIVAVAPLAQVVVGSLPSLPGLGLPILGGATQVPVQEPVQAQAIVPPQAVAVPQQQGATSLPF